MYFNRKLVPGEGTEGLPIAHVRTYYSHTHGRRRGSHAAPTRAPRRAHTAQRARTNLNSARSREARRINLVIEPDNSTWSHRWRRRRGGVTSINRGVVPFQTPRGHPVSLVLAPSSQPLRRDGTRAVSEKERTKGTKRKLYIATRYCRHWNRISRGIANLVDNQVQYSFGKFGTLSENSKCYKTAMNVSILRNIVTNIEVPNGSTHL